ncbi:Target of rapamycin complex 2 subunit bit61 [Colletotrichum chlorophyti]|uniref:Target of rapamycin complex 2 subunit bit61 n=1 Tax=Colletotrichum chlorophyti TaxID=708187 RepID=A0A1Q8RPF1_9PEZI|nr:Target of rapamycin complex 2 subunit bit61 [Colletotrichum chlorophyti]
MQPARPPPRAPGSFSPLPGSTASSAPQPQRPRPPARAESSSSEESLSIHFVKPRSHAPSAPTAPSSGTPIYAQFTSQANSSTASLQNFSRPTAQRSGTTPGGPVGPGSGGGNDLSVNVSAAAAARTASPLTKGHSRKHSQTPGLFDSSLPSTTTSNLSQVGMSHPSASTSTLQYQNQHPSPALSASHIAAQAAVLQHKSSQQHQQLQSQQLQHARQRSQTVPSPANGEADGVRRSSNGKGPLSPPMLSLTEASGPRETGFGNQGYHNGLLGSHSAAATTAANAAFPRSGQTSPGLPQPQHQHPHSPGHQSPQLIPDPKPVKPEKSKVKLFSRPVKIGTKGDPKDKPLPSPSKIGSALASLQRGNFSTSSLIDTSGQSIYNLNNSSSATVRAVPETPTMEKEGKEKEKKHHFLSRQKHKLKDDYHLPLSSASSNSKPTDPSAPSSLYSFNLPPSPAPTATSFGKGRRDKKTEKEGSNLVVESSSLPTEWPGPSSLPSLTHTSSYLSEPIDAGKYGLNSMALDDAWPYLKAKMLVIFEGEDLRQPVEDFNRLVTLHIQYCIQRRSPNIILEDLRELLATGFASLDHTLRRTQEDKVIPALVEMWLITYTSILPYMQAVFLPLDLEFSGCGVLMNPDQARDFWGGVKASDNVSYVSPASAVLDVRRIVLTAYRDIVILPRYESLKTIFSRLSLEFLPSSFASLALASPLPDPALSSSPADSMSMMRPGTAMSLDPSVASYNSNATTLFGDGSAGGGSGGRSRAISNVSYASGGSDGQLRPFTREQNVEDSKQVTEMVGRMLQCMSILAGIGDAAGDGGDDGNNRRMEELCRLLKLNWLGRGRTGRNRRGIVGGRRREIPESIREGLRVV